MPVKTKPQSRVLPFTPSNMHQIYTGIEVPDPITFVTGSKWLDRVLYPRQGTLIKVVFLRTDLLTDYDREVIEEWEAEFRIHNGVKGIPPNTIARMDYLRSRGHKWFREVLLIMGRRAGKGYVTALCLAYVLWNYMAKGDPQHYYGVDRDKKLECLIFAGKRDQAKSNVYGDLVNVITGSVCFIPYISKDLAEILSIYAPHDFVRMRKMKERGQTSDRDQATFLIKPRESTVMAGRGPATWALTFDEMAHVVATGANRSAEEVWDAATPSLDQFGKDAFIVEPSSPWQMLGKFFENWEHATTMAEDGTWEYPNMFSVQLASWDIYFDWQRAHEIPMLPEEFDGDLGEYRYTEAANFGRLRGAIQIYDEEMRKEEQKNPDTFAVERRSQWAAALDVYLNEQKVQEIFHPWKERPERYGRPELTMQTSGFLTMTYKAHGDPSTTNANFGFALAHPEVDDKGVTHAVFDLIHHWDPADFPNHTVDYEEIEDWIWENVILKFHPDELTFDQWNSASTIQKFNKKVRSASMPKQVNVFEKTATQPVNWARAETFKKCMNQGWVHAPYYEQAELELRFLQSPRPGMVDKPSSGPVQTKDVADCVMEAVMVLLGEQANNFTHTDLNDMRPGVGMQSGLSGNPIDPGDRNPMDFETSSRLNAMSGFGASRGIRRETNMRGTHRRPR